MMTILTDLSIPSEVRAVTVRCDRCPNVAEFVIDQPSDLILAMNKAGWSVPTEGRPDFCQNCAIRMM